MQMTHPSISALNPCDAQLGLDNVKGESYPQSRLRLSAELEFAGGELDSWMADNR